MSEVRAHVSITGKVQGVWFRGATQEQARRIGVHGWVRNRLDGAVEAEIEGPPARVEQLIAWVRRGPPLARVAHVRIEWIAPTGERNGFVVTD